MPSTAKDVFLQALDQPDADRTEYVERACAGDPGLRDQVQALLKAHASADRYIGADGREWTLATGAGARGPDNTLDAGTPVGNYVIRSKLGEGGFGVVYLADQQQPILRPVALKLIKRGMDTDALLARFQVERQVLARMNHPGICKVIDAGAHVDGRPYFVMEYVDGIAIDRYCDEHRLDLRGRLRLFATVCDAVQHAHQKGAIHRDLKPSNVLVATVDGQPMPKVIDFGIAKATDQSLGTPTLTAQGHLLGTPAYMSPEQAAGSADIDTRTDVYALGAMLYELLAGRPPFEFGNMDYLRILHAIAQQDPPRPSHRRAAPDRLPPDLDWITMRCLEKDRTRRYPSAASLRADIDRFLAEQPVEAAPPSRWYHLRKLVRRHRVAFAAAALLALTLCAGIIGTSLALVQAKAAEHAATRQQAIKDAVLAFFNDDLLASVQPSSEPGRGHDVTMREVLDRVSRKLEADPARFASEPEVEAAIRLTLGEVYVNLGQFEAAERHLRRSMELHERVHGSEHDATLRPAYKLATALLSENRHEEGETLLDRVIEIQSRTHRSTDSELIRSLHERGRLRLRQSRLPEAIRILEDALARCREGGLADHPVAFAVMGRLAITRDAAGDPAAAEELFRGAYEGRARVLGPTAPDTLASALNLGAFLLKQGDLRQAEPILRPLLEQVRTVSGPRHPQTASVLVNLGILDKDLGNLDAAEAFLGEACSIGEEVHGRAHPQALQPMLHLARVVERRGDLQRAEELLQEILARGEAPLGPDHQLILNVKTDLAAVWFAAGGRTAVLEPLLRELLAANEKVFPQSHPRVVRARANYGLVLLEVRRHAEAVEHLTRAFADSGEVLGKDDPETLRTGADLADALLGCGRSGDAAKLALEVLVSGERVLDPASRELARLRLRHGTCQSALGNHAGAEEIVRRTHDALVAQFGAEDALVQDAASRLAAIQAARLGSR